MPKINSITATEILDSAGNPTIETTVVLSDDVSATSSAPSGSHTGTYAAAELRDHDSGHFNGMGVQKAVENIEKVIAPAIVGMEVVEQQKIDKKMIELDGTHTKEKLGANAILSVSQAAMKAAAKSCLLPLPLYIREFLTSDTPLKVPTPIFSLIEGGKHAGNILDFQAFLLLPASSKSFHEALEIGYKVHHSLRSLLMERNLSPLVADEGGFSPPLPNNYDALTLLKLAVDRARISFSRDAFLGLDACANTFKDAKVYRLKDKNVPISQDDLVAFYDQLFADFTLVYLEDPMAEDDWDGWKKIYEKFNGKTKIIGDDLVATNPYRLQHALESNVINGIIIKPSQIGTVTETIAVCEIARFKKLELIVSSRSAETADDFIADFAVGIGASYVKFGAPVRERIIKYNRLLALERELSEIQGDAQQNGKAELIKPQA